MRLKKYRIPLLFSGVLGLFMLGVGVIDEMVSVDEKETTKPVVSTSIKTGTKKTDLTKESLICPVKEGIEVVRYFYEVNGEHNDKALELFEGVYRQSQGIDYGSNDSFDVMAMLSGTVVEVEKDEMFGMCVTIECENDIRLIYQSLANVSVEEGQSVKQGVTIGESGHNIYEADLGNHVHITVEVNGEARNPLSLYHQKVDTIQ